MIEKSAARKAPVITAFYAPEKVRYGGALKLYIEAEAPEGDMLKIASVADQAGYGHYPTDWIYLKPQYQRYFRGYLQWNTFSSSTSPVRDWTHVTLKVSAFDKAGNESNAAIFQFQFGSEAAPEVQPPAPFCEADPRLGHLNINLVEPSLIRGWFKNYPIRVYPHAVFFKDTLAGEKVVL